jgi:hypothetical protein
VGSICGEDEDYFRFWAKGGCSVEVDLLFVDEAGDLDLKLLGGGDKVLARSVSVSDDEHISHALERSSLITVRVYGWRGAENTYELRVRQDCESPAP